MADILIRGMEMPQNCFFCKIYTHNGGNCLQLQKHVSTDRFSQERDKDCPLVPVPPHGRLGDLDRLVKVMCEGLAPSEKGSGFKTPIDILRAIANAPTIIPSSEVYE